MEDAATGGANRMDALLKRGVELPFPARHRNARLVNEDVYSVSRFPKRLEQQ